MKIHIVLNDGTLIDTITRVEEYDMSLVFAVYELGRQIRKAIENGKRQEDEAAREAVILEEGG